MATDETTATLRQGIEAVAAHFRRERVNSGPRGALVFARRTSWRLGI
jgi:hypothetical protein